MVDTLIDTPLEKTGFPFPCRLQLQIVSLRTLYLHPFLRAGFLCGLNPCGSHVHSDSLCEFTLFQPCWSERHWFLGVASDSTTFIPEPWGRVDEEIPFKAEKSFGLCIVQL